MAQRGKTRREARRIESREARGAERQQAQRGKGRREARGTKRQ